MKTFLSSLAAVLLGSLITWALAAFWRFYRSPVLTIEFNPKRTGEDRLDAGARLSLDEEKEYIPSGSLQTNSPGVMRSSSNSVGSVPDGPPPLWRWFHLEVHNRGLTRATVCQGYIERVELLDEGGSFHRAKEWVNRVPMRWANKGNMVRNGLGPDVWDRLDLFRVNHGDPVLEWVTPSQDPGVQLRYGPGDYRVLVAVSWGKDRQEKRCFRVHFGQTIDEVDVRMIPHSICVD